MTTTEYLKAATVISTEAGVLDSLHAYLVQEVSRICRTCNLFRLFDGKLGKVIEIGPFFAYTPFMLQGGADSYVVIEGDDPAVYPLRPLYEKRGIDLRLLDLFDVFGGVFDAPAQLPFNEGEFDTVICWETMEHFNFNPVKFVRELHRILKPGGIACITVPNKASLERHVALLTGYRDEASIDAYFRFEDYLSNGRRRFLGFHWREYSCRELALLFQKAGFEVRKATTFVEFQTRECPTLFRRVVRGIVRGATAVLPRCGTNVLLEAAKAPPTI